MNGQKPEPLTDEQVAWLRNNMTFYNTAETSAPVLASVSRRIWYHATDDMESYPFDAVLRAAMGSGEAASAPQGGDERLQRIAWLIGAIFCYGDFKAETFNERELEKLLRENGTFWETKEDFESALAGAAPEPEAGPFVLDLPAQPEGPPHSKGKWK